MIKTIREHVPGFVDLDRERYVSVFETTEDLLKIDWVQRAGSALKDSEFMISPNDDDSKKGHLMTVKKDNSTWWVVGYISDLEGIDLPEWVHPSKQKERP